MEKKVLNEVSRIKGMMKQMNENDYHNHPFKDVILRDVNPSDAFFRNEKTHEEKMSEHIEVLISLIKDIVSDSGLVEDEDFRVRLSKHKSNHIDITFSMEMDVEDNGDYGKEIISTLLDKTMGKSGKLDLDFVSKKAIVISVNEGM
jgi:hypothetical protein